MELIEKQRHLQILLNFKNEYEYRGKSSILIFLGLENNDIMNSIERNISYHGKYL